MNGANDLIIGAPKQGRGRAHIFYGPFGGAGDPQVITADDADLSVGSPYIDDYDFGELVAPVSDLNGDGVPEFRVRAWFLDAAGVESTRTYILDGATADGLFVITGDEPFDPWAFVEGDVDGDGDVDQDDLEAILKNLDLEGEGLTSFDGDLNGDGVVNMLDYDIADWNFGNSLFGSLPGPGLCHCEGSIWTCDPDDDLQPPGNMEGICSSGGFICCDAVCQGGSYFALIDVGLDSYSPLLTMPTEDVTVYGMQLINILSSGDEQLVFDPVGLGAIHVFFSFSVCCNECKNLLDAYIVQPLPDDADGDGFSYHCEGLMDTNDQNPYDFPVINVGDNDSDGVINLDECNLGLDMNWYDTDGDAMPDGWELDHEGVSPHASDGQYDFDGDGVPNVLEYLYGSDLADPLSGADPAHDADGDGFIDWIEEVLGSSPSDQNSIPDVEFDGESMYWVEVNGILQYLESPLIELCVGDCCGGAALPEFVCVGDILCLEASGADNESGTYQWSVTEGASFIGGSTGAQVIIRIDEGIAIWVVSTRGDCAGGSSTIGVGIDLDIDSNNDNGFGSPDRSDEEDETEDDSDTPGKLIALNTGNPPCQ